MGLTISCCWLAWVPFGVRQATPCMRKILQGSFQPPPPASQPPCLANRLPYSPSEACLPKACRPKHVSILTSNPTPCTSVKQQQGCSAVGHPHGPGQGQAAAQPGPHRLRGPALPGEEFCSSSKPFLLRCSCGFSWTLLGPNSFILPGAPSACTAQHPALAPNAVPQPMRSFYTLFASAGRPPFRGSCLPAAFPGPA